MTDNIASLPETFSAKGINALLPGCCGACGKWPAHGLCQTCYALFKKTNHRCYVCAIELPSAQQDICGHCLKYPFAFDEAVAAVSYTSPWRELVQKLKFYDGTDHARLVAQLLYLMLCAHKKLDEPPDLILPIPVTRQRMRVRGYNQSWEIAKHFSRFSGIIAAPYILQHRLQMTQMPESQTQRKRKERFRALKGMFFVAEKDLGSLQGKHIVLLDDVMTTGATLHHAALTLKKAGVKKVSAWVFARTAEERNQS